MAAPSSMADITSVSDVLVEFKPKNPASNGGVLYIEIQAGVGGDWRTDTPGSARTFMLKVFLEDSRLRNATMSFAGSEPGVLPYRYRVDIVRGSSKRYYYADGYVQTKQVPADTLRLQLFLHRGIKAFAIIQPKGGAVQAFPLTGEQTFGALSIQSSVVTVQDIRRLPPSGEPISQSLLFPAYASYNDEMASPGPRQMLMYIMVRHIPNGVEFTWLATNQTLRVRLRDPTDGASGYAFFLNAFPQFEVSGSRFYDYDDLLHIRTCGNVELSLTPPDSEVRTAITGDVPVERSGSFPDPILDPDQGEDRFHTLLDREKQASLRSVEKSVFFRWQEVGGLDELPAPDQAFEVSVDDDRARHSYAQIVTSDESTFWTQLVVDMGIGFIPIAGDIIDFMDFNLALRTGKDKWGNEVDDLGLFLMGLACIPLAGEFFKRMRPLL
jgi:hypothetical protein